MLHVCTDLACAAARGAARPVRRASERRLGPSGSGATARSGSRARVWACASGPRPRWRSRAGDAGRLRRRRTPVDGSAPGDRGDGGRRARLRHRRRRARHRRSRGGRGRAPRHAPEEPPAALAVPQAGDPASCCCAGSASSTPRRLDDYRAHGGYAALRRAFALGPAGVIREVTDSGLVGRGGAAFPTGRKWQATAAQPDQPHYLVCNADESEPGTFKDRVIMEGDPYALIEAMTIAGYATGAHQGYLYLRGEYPRALRRLEHAIAQARARGLLGDDVLGQGYAFDIEIRRGAGAYICGEETALFNSIEGYRGEPRSQAAVPRGEGPVRQADRRRTTSRRWSTCCRS